MENFRHPSFSILLSRLSRLIKDVRSTSQAYFTALIILQQNLLEIPFHTLDGFLAVPALCSLSLKLTDQPRDLKEVVRRYMQMVRIEMGKKQSIREEQHFKRILGKVKTEEVLLLIRNQFNLKFQYQPVQEEHPYLKKVSQQVLHQFYKAGICLLMSPKDLCDLALVWGCKLTDRSTPSHLQLREWGEGGSRAEEWLDEETRERILSDENEW